MPTTQSNAASETIQQIRKQFNEALERQADQLEELAQRLKSLQSGQQRLEEAAFHLLGPLDAASGLDGARAWSPAGILAGVRKLATASYATQVLEHLAEEAARMNIRSVVFDVRGGAAWASAASGFQPELPADELRTLAVSLNQEGPFRRAVETSEPVETDFVGLENHGNVLARLNPPAKSRILLAPVRSADSVVAILYTDHGETREPSVIDALRVLAEFAGAHIDRLMALSTGFVASGIAHPKAESDYLPECSPTGPQCNVEVVQPETPQPPAGVPAEALSAEAPEVASIEPPVPTPEGAASQVATEDAAPPDNLQASAEAPVIAHRPEEEEKVHRDAKRFSKLLVSEIELYNKISVEEGRRNKDLYQRLKKDIDRSRETYEKRFGHTVAKQMGYFHEELVRTLAQNDPALLGSDYPGPMA